MAVAWHMQCTTAAWFICNAPPLHGALCNAPPLHVLISNAPLLHDSYAYSRAPNAGVLAPCMQCIMMMQSTARHTIPPLVHAPPMHFLFECMMHQMHLNASFMLVLHVHPADLKSACSITLHHTACSIPYLCCVHCQTWGSASRDRCCTRWGSRVRRLSSSVRLPVQGATSCAVATILCIQSLDRFHNILLG